MAISTHALREEGDPRTVPAPPPERLFLPTPSARRATYQQRRWGFVRRFLPTPSARRATKSSRGCPSGQPNFYPRPPRGGRLRRSQFLHRRPVISTHALREEGDDLFELYNQLQNNFYPRPPRGGRPAGNSGPYFRAKISTHALREEGDGSDPPVSSIISPISTHALREEGDGRGWRR